MPHYMRPNHACRVPRHHVCVDTETYPATVEGHPAASRHELMLGTAARFRLTGSGPTHRHELDFDSRREFWDWLYSTSGKGTQTWVWSHNAGFDLTTLGLWDEIDEGRLVIKGSESSPRSPEAKAGKARDSPLSLVTASPPFLCDCVDGVGKSYRFIDSLNWCFTSIADIGRMIGLPKLDMPGEIGEPGDWRAYCRRDVAILETLVVRICELVETHDLGNMQWTLSSQAMSHYRHRHMPPGILIGPDEQHRPLERRGYYAARQEVYFRGLVVQPGTDAFEATDATGRNLPKQATSPVHRIDCNACYPYVMGRNVFPSRPFRTLHAPTVRQLSDHLKHFIGCAVVRIYSEREPYPQRRNGRTTWRIGRVDTCLVGPELVRAVDMGHVIGVEVCQLYVTAPLFASWFNQTEQWRRAALDKGDELEQRLLKRMRNSLHGKFGQTGRVWQTVEGQIAAQRWGVYDHLDTTTCTHTTCRGVAGMLQVLRADDEAKGSSPIIAACVTAYAREHMRSARIAIGARSVFYEDADSLHISSAGLDRATAGGWIDPTEPGKFKVEASADTAEYRGVKNYTFGDTVVKAGHADKGSYDAKGTWHQTEWLSLDSLLSTGKPEAPITVDREVAEPESHPLCGYDHDGWILYSPGS